MPRVAAIPALRVVRIRMDQPVAIAASRPAQPNAVFRAALRAAPPRAEIPAAARAAAAVAIRAVEAVAHPTRAAAIRADFFPGALIIHTQGPEQTGPWLFLPAFSSPSILIPRTIEESQTPRFPSEETPRARGCSISGSNYCDVRTPLHVVTHRSRPCNGRPSGTLYPGWHRQT
jgi:hypothetical protein